MRTQLRLFLCLAAAVLCALATTGGTRPVAEAHGTLDQFPSTDPGCLDSVFRASAAPSPTVVQEFVPSGLYVAHVALCLKLTSTANLLVHIRSGTAAAPGAILATAGANAVLGPATKYVEFELPTLLPVTPGTTYVLEVSGFPAFTWRGTCGAVSGACTTVDTIIDYTAGVSSAPSPVQDLAFRTYTSTDADGDLIGDPVDNCPGVANTDQANNDANLIDLTPPKANDDTTWVNSDNLGDACDPDDDNDGLSDADEATGASCIISGTPVASDPLLLDTDGDHYADGAECAHSKSPASSAAADQPNFSDCAATGDNDGDKLSNRLEVCMYNTNPDSANTDGDLCSDGREVASLNNDTTVNSGDQGLLASEYGIVPPHLLNMDLNRDGFVNSGDQGLQASQFGACP